MACKRLFAGILIGLVFPALSGAQAMPQTARQALIEMVFSKTPGSFDKHLPEATLAVIRSAPPGSPASMIQTFSLISSQMQAKSGQFQTFETGPILLTAEDPATNSKFELRMVHDDLRGEKDEIEVSLRALKNGESQTGGISPRLTFVMQQEKDIWRLHDLTFSIGVSLTDPNVLKALATPVKPPQTVASGNATAFPASTVTENNVSFNAVSVNESSASAGVRAINSAEANYAAAYPGLGYACSLSAMGGMGSGVSADEHHAMLLDPRLSNGRKNGYVFRISNCNGTPAKGYAVIATPADASSGTKVFCSDQSGNVRSGMDVASCLGSGKVAN